MNQEVKKWLRISNKGELDKKGLSLMGASVKTNDDPIGSYGSGLKYSIASLLRSEVEFRVFSGVTEVKVNTRDTDFRGKVFKVVYIDDEKTSITTEMGVGVSDEWNSEFPVFREIFSNALDSGEAKLAVVDTTIGVEGYTAIYIQYTPQYAKFFDKFSDYFATETKELSLSTTKYGNKIRILPKTEDKNIRIFRKGILTHWVEEEKSSKPSLFNYDLSLLDINESRRASNMYIVKQHIGEALFQMDSLFHFKLYLKHIEGANTGLFEHDCLPSDWQTPKISSEIKEYLLTQKFVGIEHIKFMPEEPDPSWRRIQFNLLKILLVAIPDLNILGVTASGAAAFPAKPSEALENRVIDAMELLRTTSYAHKLDGIKIEFVTFDEYGTLGRAHEGTVQLSIRLEDKDINFVAKVIMEELEHLSTGFNDSSRDFQNHWIDLYFNELLNRKPKNVKPLKVEDNGPF